MHRSRRCAVLTRSFNAARRPGDVCSLGAFPAVAEVRRGSRQELGPVRNSILRRRQRQRQAKHRRTTGNRPRQAGHRLGASLRRRAPALRARPYLALAAISGPQANGAVAVRTSAGDSARVGREKRNHRLARGGGWEGKPPEDSLPTA
jgi:hypothetical protein